MDKQDSGRSAPGEAPPLASTARRLSRSAPLPTMRMAARSTLDRARQWDARGEFARLRSSSCQCSAMSVDLSPAFGRPIRLSLRWTIVVLEPVPGVVALGVFLEGDLLYDVVEPAGEAFAMLVSEWGA